MKQKVTVEKVKEMAKLAHISVSEEEAVKYANQIESIINYVEKLSEVDTTGVEFKSHTDLKNVFREDIPEESLDSSNALRNRKDKVKNGSLVIKSVL